MPSSISLAKSILVIGATSGIGRSLALALKALPSNPTVIAVGRREDRLSQLSKDHGLETIQFDVNTDPAALKVFVDETLNKFPELDAVLFSSGIQHPFEFTRPQTVNVTNVLSEINVNYTSIVLLSNFFLSHFLKLESQGRPSWIMPVSSGLAFTHSPWVPNYGAVKAALHSFTASLRIQLRATKVNVIEIIPPLVESELHDAQGATSVVQKFWMPLDEYTSITLRGLVKGDAEVAAGTALDNYNLFEKAKMQALAGRYVSSTSNMVMPENVI